MQVSWLKKLLDKPEPIKIYVCGPTVYDDVHIGNIRPILVFDILVRYLREIGKEYVYVHNITDIDDKIIKKSIEENTTETEISEKYTQEYLSILKDLNVIIPDHLPKVTQEIPGIISVLEDLEKKSYAYFKNGTLWFDISKFEDKYSEISNQKLDQLSSKSKDDTNFALWKKTTEGKTWNSPWGEGRPGWHVECFCFIKKFFNGPVDIHGGGVDLKFPHHENENILSHAFFGKKLSENWLHVGHVLMKNEKISKSSGNKSFLVKDLIKKYGPDVVRMFLFSSSFNKPLEISDEFLKTISNNWNALVLRINNIKSGIIVKPEKELKIKVPQELISVIENGINLPNILTFCFETLEWCSYNFRLQAKNPDTEDIFKNYEKILEKINELIFSLRWLGFNFKNLHSDENVDLLYKYRISHNLKKYEESDKIREKLQKLGLII